MLSSPFISLDVDPHDGKFEKEFIDLLGVNRYKGMVYMDDTFMNKFPNLRDYWETITQKKVNVSKVGHGSGIVLLNGCKTTTLFSRLLIELHVSIWILSIKTGGGIYNMLFVAGNII